MSRILFTTMPMAGHLRPGLPIAKALLAAGHEVAWYSGANYEAEIARTGARIYRMAAELDFDDALADERAGTAGRKPGLATLKRAMIDLFINPVPDWVADIDAVLDDFRPDVVVAEQGFMAGPFAGQRRGIPSVVFSVSPLGLTSVDAPPFGTGLQPGSRLRNRTLNWALRTVVLAGPQRAAEQALARLGLPPRTSYFMDWGSEVASRYLVPSVPQLEYPRSDLPAHVEFVGAFLPDPQPGWERPGWWDDVLAARASGRPVVLVTQGTIATDPANLILPTIEGLAGREPLVVVTTVREDPDAVLPPDRRPANLRMTRFLPHGEVMHLTDVFVTNGGYGGVQTALAHGVPVVIAGTTEDKAEVSARITWAGVGVALGTDTPSAAQVRTAVADVLATPSYRARARQLQEAYAAHPGARRAAEAVLEVAGAVQPVG
ncbi:glycosyltransferase [Blastococcus sp. SYSU D00669]